MINFQYNLSTLKEVERPYPAGAYYIDRNAQGHEVMIPLTGTFKDTQKIERHSFQITAVNVESADAYAIHTVEQQYLQGMRMRASFITEGSIILSRKLELPNARTIGTHVKTWTLG